VLERTLTTDPDGAGPPVPEELPAPVKQLRGDIQGLRAIAVGMVLLYHAGLPFVKGGFAGVDVFFVISGFLITGLMVREVERTGRLSARNFWARRAKRLLPATALVLVTVAVLSLAFLPPVRWASTSQDLLAASLYVTNWRLAWTSADYLAQNYAASPVQHFWSLAVEEQFYLFWPLVVLLVSGLGRRFGLSLRRYLLVGALLITIPSLAWSVHLGPAPEAYFVTTTRAWELGIGAITALLSVRLDAMSRRLGQILTWAGTGTLIAVAVWLPGLLPWPGSGALVPTVATAAVIAGGPAAGSAGAAFLLGRAPFRWLGDLSYSLYLWHWPLIVFATVHWTTLSPLQGALVVAFSFIPAYLTHRLVEEPLHRSRLLARFPARALAVGAACTVVGMIAAVGLRIAIPGVPVIPAADRPGAVALTTDPGTAIDWVKAASITPDPLVARDDLPDLYARNCQSDYAQAVPVMCEFGNRASARWVVLVGDSRAAQWSPALQLIAAQQGWRLTTITKAGCPFADVTIYKGAKGRALPYTSCRQWNDATAGLLTGPVHPDLVITSAFAPYLVGGKGGLKKGEASRQAMIKGLHRSWKALNTAGVPVVGIRETPAMGKDIAECVSEHRTSLNECSTPAKKALRTAHAIQPAALGLAESASIDLTPTMVCPAAVCPVVIGNVLIYRDEHHLTATYSRSLAPALELALEGLRQKKLSHGELDRLLPAH
jgi:peptidoglycan/LPS O-acetylase OafA/YrhL